MATTTKWATREEMSDAMIALAKGSPAEQSAAIGVIAPYVKNLVRKHGVPKHLDADDVEQIALMRLLDAARTFDPSRSPFPFVAIVVSRVILTEMETATRTNHPTRRLPSLDQLRTDNGFRTDDGAKLRDLIVGHREQSPAIAAIVSERDALLDEMIALLPAILTPFELAAFVGIRRGLTYGEIASAERGTTKAVDNALARARRKIAAIVPASDDDQQSRLLAFVESLHELVEQRRQYDAAAPERKRRNRVTAKIRLLRRREAAESFPTDGRHSDMTNVQQIEIDLYDLIESQASLQIQFNELEKAKAEEGAKLNAARSAKTVDQPEVDRLKIALFDLIERQSSIAAEAKSLDEKKAVKHRELVEARQAEATK